MKEIIRKFICIVISFLIILNCSAFTNVKSVSKSNLKTSIPTSRTNYGFVKPKFSITRKQQNSLQKGTNLPSKYDLRDYGDVTPVKNQGNIGTCWAFAAISSLESGIMMREKSAYDFSEINLAVNSGFDKKPDDGGNEYMAAAYFARWGGPVNESDDPYPNLAEPSNIIPRTNINPARHVQEVLFIPDRNNSLDNDLIKKAVMQYGAVDTTMFMNPSYYNEKTYSCYCDTVDVNHAVTIIGWDDNYSKNNFIKIPAGNGAFICKNSWGTDWGDKGYFYVSYYDANIGKDNAVFNNAESVSNYSHIYQYDPLGMGGLTSYGNESWFSNVFTADSSENLTAASFYTNKMNTSYEIYVENDFDDYGFSRIKSNKVNSGSIEMPGYHTIKFDKSVPVIKGKKFAVAVKIDCSEGADVAEEDTDFKDKNTVISSANQSFTSGDGVTWTGIQAGDPNVCLKAFTNDCKFVETSGVSLNAYQMNLNIGDSYKFIATISPSNATVKDISWSSSDDNVVSIDQSGKVIGKSRGIATVTAKTIDGKFKAQCKVCVRGELKVTSKVPENNDNLPIACQLVLKFNYNIFKNKDFSNITVVDKDGNDIPINVNISDDTLVIKPTTNLKYESYYKLVVPKESVEDELGSVMKEDYTFKFSTRDVYVDSIYIDSPAIEKEIRNQLNKPQGNISSDDMKNINYLYVEGRNIKSLKGLEYAVNLEHIDIENCNLYDISDIKNLKNLNYINFNDNHISNIDSLKGLTKLNKLELSNNFITDINPISNLISLNVLYLSNNSISDLSPLINLINNQGEDSHNDVVYVDNNYINPDDSQNTQYMNYIANKVSSLLNYGQKNNAILLNEEIGRNKYVQNNNEYGFYLCVKEDEIFKLIFKNNIKQSSNYDQITLSYFDQNYNYVSVPINKSIKSNELIIKPNLFLSTGHDYCLKIFDDSVCDATGKSNEYKEYDFKVDNLNYDINGKFDIQDLAAMGKKYKTTINDSNWDGNFDFNEDGRIDIYDLVSASKILD